MMLPPLPPTIILKNHTLRRVVPSFTYTLEQTSLSLFHLRYFPSSLLQRVDGRPSNRDPDSTLATNIRAAVGAFQVWSYPFEDPVCGHRRAKMEENDSECQIVQALLPQFAFFTRCFDYFDYQTGETLFEVHGFKVSYWDYFSTFDLSTTPLHSTPLASTPATIICNVLPVVGLFKVEWRFGTRNQQDSNNWTKPLFM
jgi:hypothetical protein